MTDRITDLFIEFDEMGFIPTTVCPNAEQYAIDWRERVRKEFARLTAENQRLREEAAEQKSIAEHEHATQMERFEGACDYKAENAELRARLTKTVEIPCKIVYKTCDYDDTLRIVEIVARWIWDAKDNVTKCSMCGKSALYIREKDIHSTFREHYSPYCPHCGAKMELTSEDDNG